MSPRSRAVALVLAALVSATGCQIAKPSAPAVIGKGGKGSTAASATPGPGTGGLTTKGMPASALRVVPQTGPVVTLTGKAKLISDHGAGLIANNGGGLIANNGGGIISNNTGGLIANNGGGLIANNGGGLVAKTKYGLAQATPGPAAGPAAALAEFALADADITIHDAAGRMLVDAQNKPITARSDKAGGYKLSAALPAENLVMRIKLWNGGELSAILAKGEGGSREVEIDTAATLGATYVLSKFVKGDQKTYDKLPASEADRLRRDLDVLRTHLQAKPVYEAGALVALADQLRRKEPKLDQTLEDIEVLLLGGLGDGQSADRVALNRPTSLAAGPDGTLYIGEEDFGRVRAVSPDGKLTTLIDGAAGTIKYNLVGMIDMVRGPDGSLYLASDRRNCVVRVKPDGTQTLVVGHGGEEATPAGRPGPEVDLRPQSMTIGPDGTLYVADRDATRVLAVGADGVATEFAPHPSWDQKRDNLAALAVGADGRLLAAVHHEGGEGGGIWRLGPDGAWTAIKRGLAIGQGDLEVGADGRLWVLEQEGRRLSRLEADGLLTVVAGEGGEAGSPTLYQAATLALTPDGTLYMADRRTNLVHARTPAGTWRLAAGAEAGVQTGANGDLTFNGPTGVAFDAAGLMYVAEGTGHALKRWDGATLTVVAGGVKGDAGDGGPGADARFDTPGALCMRGADVLVMDGRNQRIRAYGPDGVVRTVVGDAKADEDKPVAKGEVRESAMYGVKGGGAMAVGPDGLLYWSTSGGHQILRQRKDGKVELVAGKPYGADDSLADGEDGQAPVDTSLTAPMGLAFGPDGALYVADTGNQRIRRITGIDTPQVRIETFAGTGRVDSVSWLFGLQPGWEASEEGAQATKAHVIAPGQICFDAAGALYVAEIGTANFAALSTPGDSVDKAGVSVDLLPKVPPRIRKITPDGRITTVIGPGGKLFTNPEASDALIMPTGMTIDPKGRLVIVDIRGNSVRFVPAGAF